MELALSIFCPDCGDVREEDVCPIHGAALQDGAAKGAQPSQPPPAQPRSPQRSVPRSPSMALDPMRSAQAQGRRGDSWLGPLLLMGFVALLGAITIWFNVRPAGVSLRQRLAEAQDFLMAPFSDDKLETATSSKVAVDPAEAGAAKPQTGASRHAKGGAK